MFLKTETISSSGPGKQTKTIFWFQCDNCKKEYIPTGNGKVQQKKIKNFCSTDCYNKNPKSCLICLKEFIGTTGCQKTCSDECLKKHTSNRKKKTDQEKIVDRQCKFCNQTYSRSRERNGFCSRSCASKKYIQDGTYDEWKNYAIPKQGIEINCIICNKVFYISQGLISKRLCCSRVCSTKYISKTYVGPKNKTFGIKQKQEQKDKQKETLLKKYNVSNAYQLAKIKIRSKPSKEIFDFLLSKNSNIDDEYPIICDSNRYKADICIIDKKIIIEFFGNYWHCNPLFYSYDYYNKKKQKFAHEIWQEDKIRTEKLVKQGYKVIILWENDYMKDKENRINILQKIIDEEKI